MKLSTIALSVILFINFCYNVDCKKKNSKSVTTLLEAKWLDTPLVLEIAEYLADESVDYYWNFIDSISSLNPPFKSIGKHAKYYCVNVIFLKYCHF